MVDLSELKGFANDKKLRALPYPCLLMEDYLVSHPRGQDAVFLLLTPVIKPGYSIWHYTGAAAAHSINKTGILRAMHYKDLADGNEIQYGINLARRAYSETSTGQYPLAARKGVKKLLDASIQELFDFPFMFYVQVYLMTSDISGKTMQSKGVQH